MQRASLLLALATLTLPLVAACKATDIRRTGFLSEYSKLQEVDSDNFAYTNPGLRKGLYPKLIFDPITVTLQDEDHRRFSDEEIRELVSYANTKMNAVLARHFELVTTPGLGTARVRVALTDMAKSKPLMNIIPQMRTSGAGRGGAVVEVEFLDSRTNEQLFAAIRRSRAEFLSASGFTPLSDVKAAIDAWAERTDRSFTELQAAE